MLTLVRSSGRPVVCTITGRTVSRLLFTDAYLGVDKFESHRRTAVLRYPLHLKDSLRDVFNQSSVRNLRFIDISRYIELSSCREDLLVAKDMAIHFTREKARSGNIKSLIFDLCRAAKLIDHDSLELVVQDEHLRSHLTPGCLLIALTALFQGQKFDTLTSVYEQAYFPSFSVDCATLYLASLVVSHKKDPTTFDKATGVYLQSVNLSRKSRISLLYSYLALTLGFHGLSYDVANQSHFVAWNLRLACLVQMGRLEEAIHSVDKILSTKNISVLRICPETINKLIMEVKNRQSHSATVSGDVVERLAHVCSQIDQRPNVDSKCTLESMLLQPIDKKTDFTKEEVAS